MNKSYLVANGKMTEVKGNISIPGWQAENIWGGGKMVTPQKLAELYMSSVWAFTCITIRADMMAGVEWEITDANKEPLPDDADAVRVLREVNQETNWNDLIRGTESDLLIFGRAYWLKQRKSGPAQGLLRLNPVTMGMTADSTGIDHFTQTLPDKRIDFPRDDVVYFREYNPLNDLDGLSHLQVAMASANSEINVSEYLATFFKNNAMPPFIMTTEQPMTEPQMEETMAWWRKIFGGAKNQHKVGFAGYGLKPEVVGYPTKDLAMAEVMGELRRNVCAIFRVPPSIAGAWEAANYATADAQRKAMIQDVAIPRSEYFSGVIEAEYLADFDTKFRMNWLFDRLAVMAPDKLAEAQRHEGLVQFGIEDPRAAAEEVDVTPVGDYVPNGAIPAPAPFRPAQNAANELMQWHRFATRRLNNGHDVDQNFDTEHIAPALKGAIEGQLAGVKTHEELERVFAMAREWSGYP